MELKDKLLNSYLAFQEDYALSEELHQTRLDALKVFEAQGFPPNVKRLGNTPP